MAQKFTSEEQSVSLFPMFNILVCTLGVLLFILTTLSILSVGAGKSIRIVAEEMEDSQDVENKSPHFLEWDGAYLISYPGRDSAHFEENLREISTYTKTYRYMRKVLANTAVGDSIDFIAKNKARRYAFLLVRPSGFDNLREVKGFFQDKGLDIGYEPVDQVGTLKVN